MQRQCAQNPQPGFICKGLKKISGIPCHLFGWHITAYKAYILTVDTCFFTAFYLIQIF